LRPLGLRSKLAAELSRAPFAKGAQTSRKTAIHFRRAETRRARVRKVANFEKSSDSYVPALSARAPKLAEPTSKSFNNG
jgi:hypothetical protein